MASAKKRLGRGLGGMISGAAPAPAKKAEAPKKADKKASSKKDAGKASEKKLTAPAQAEASAIKAAPGYREIPIKSVEPSPYQARRDIEPEHIAELAESIRSEGLLQPITVRQRDDGQFELIAGERRWRACMSLGLPTVTAHIIEASDSSSAVKSLIENLQRRDLNPIEEARGYGSLMQDFKLTQEQVAERVGKPRPTIANALRLLQLSREIQGYLSKGMLSPGQAKPLLAIEHQEQRELLARRIIESGLNARQVEDLARRAKNENNRASRTNAPSGAEATIVQDIEKKIASRLNAPVSLKHGAKKGKLVIEYYGNDDLQRLMELLGVQE